MLWLKKSLKESISLNEKARKNSSSVKHLAPMNIVPTKRYPTVA